MLLGGSVEAGMRRWQAALNVIGVGWFVGVSLLLGVLGGLWLDSRFGTEPLFVMVGLFLGIIVAAYGVYRMLVPLIRNRQDKEDD
jgi:F0F1-type ATP synthase assembly protein I